MIYGQDGCAYCHTQQIRYLDTDVRRFGAATLAWETIFDYPQLWGTRRIGPDLSREGSVRSPDWQLAHLYAPRSMVRDSVMPPFPWLFNGAADRPKQGARDLLAYIETLGRNRELAGKEGEARARAACECSDDERRLAFDSSTLNASAAMTRRHGDYPKLPSSQDRNRGQRLYAGNCASCHGAHGQGDGAGAAGLNPRPTNLSEHEYSLDRLSSALWNGVAGTAMPAWRDMPLQDLSAIAEVVRRFHSAEPEPTVSGISKDVIDLGEKVYAARCAQCHGENGAGDGTAVDQFPIAASNFQTQRLNLDAIVRVLRNGVDGTPMPPWTRELPEAELSAVASYVRGFYRK